MVFEGKKHELLADPSCRSGYEYARLREEIWRGETVQALQAMAEAYAELYRLNGNRNSLGIALYLQELLASKPGRKRAGPDERQS